MTFPRLPADGSGGSDMAADISAAVDASPDPSTVPADVRGCQAMVDRLLAGVPKVDSLAEHAHLFSSFDGLSVHVDESMPPGRIDVRAADGSLFAVIVEAEGGRWFRFDGGLIEKGSVRG